MTDGFALHLVVYPTRHSNVVNENSNNQAQDQLICQDQDQDHLMNLNEKTLI